MGQFGSRNISAPIKFAPYFYRSLFLLINRIESNRTTVLTAS